MQTRGIRGAISVEKNNKDQIFETTRQLLAEILKVNELQIADIASIFFTMTPDLNAAFPAEAARQIGFENTPLMCSAELDITGAMEKVIRVLVLTNTDKAQDQMKAVYLKEAAGLRPDLA